MNCRNLLWPVIGATLILLVASCGLARPVSKTQAAAPASMLQPPLTSTHQLPLLSPENAGQIGQLAQAGSGLVTTIHWSPDGKVMAVASTLGIYLHDAETRQELRLLKTESPVVALDFSSAGDRLISGDIGGNAQIWDITSGRQLYSVQGKDVPSTKVAFSPDGQLAMAQWHRGGQIWEAQSGQISHTFVKYPAWLDALSPDFSTRLVDGTGLLNLKSGRWVEIMPPGTPIVEATFSPDGGLLAVATTNDTIYLYEVATGRRLHTLSIQQSSRFLTFDSTEQLLAVSGYDNTTFEGTVKVWDVVGGHLLHTLTGQLSGSTEPDFSPDSHLLAVGGADGSLQLWDVKSGQVRSKFGAFDETIDRVTFSPNGHRLASETLKRIRLWDVDTGQLLVVFDKYRSDQPASPQVSFSQQGQLFVGNGGQTTIWQWDAAAGQLRQQHLISGTTPLALSPDGQRLATGGPEHTAQLWDTATGQRLYRLDGHSDAITGLAFSPDGLWLVSSANKPITGSGPAGNSDLRVWQAETGQLLASHEMYPWGVRVGSFISADKLATSGYIFDSCGRGGGAMEVAVWNLAALLSANDKIEPVWRNSGGGAVLSADGRVVAGLVQLEACLQPGVVYAWDALTGIEKAVISFFDPTPVYNNNYVDAYTLSPDGAMLVIGIRDGQFGLWDATTGQPIHTFESQTADVTSLVYSPDARLLVSGHRDGQLKVWDINTRKLLHTLTGHTTRVSRLVFSSDGEILLSGSDDGTVRLWGVRGDGK